MKRSALLRGILGVIFLYAFNNASAQENVIVEAKFLSDSCSSSKFFIKPYYVQEGFCGDTLVQIPCGYKAIKKLTAGDFVIDYSGNEKKIITITKHFVKRYIKLTINNEVICAGCDQLYYTIPRGIWVAAQHIMVGDALFNNVNQRSVVIDVELVYEDKLLYCFTVEDHVFCVTQSDLCVHNAQALIIGAASMSLGSVTMVNPIVATIGATIALSAIAHKAYQAYIQQCADNDQKVALPEDVILAERFYYVQRCTDLEIIKQELLYIKKGLENIKAFCSIDSASFTHQFLKQTNIQNVYNKNQLLKVSAGYEMQLSENQKKNLRLLREIELVHLE